MFLTAFALGAALAPPPKSEETTTTKAATPQVVYVQGANPTNRCTGSVQQALARLGLPATGGEGPGGIQVKPWIPSEHPDAKAFDAIDLDVQGCQVMVPHGVSWTKKLNPNAPADPKPAK